MKPWLRIVWNFLKTFWWVIVLVVVIIITGFGLVYLVKKKKIKKEDTENAVDDVRKTQSLVANVARRVSTAVTDMKVEKAVIAAKTEIRREELESIRSEPDGKKRREKLAAVLKKSL